MSPVPAPVRYTITIADPASHDAEVTAEFPVDQGADVELMMAVWSPGFYRREDYAARVRNLVAHAPDGAPLQVTQPAPHRWRVASNGASAMAITYRLHCLDQSVTTNWIDAGVAVLNGPATFITLAGAPPRPHEVTLRFPATWTHAMTALPRDADGPPYSYRAADFDALADSPILAGALAVYPFVADGALHVLSAAGECGQWDGQRAARDLEQIVRANLRFWGRLPYREYHFLTIFREGGGGLEHADSTLVTANPARSGTPEGYRAWVGLMSHEYFHAFNVKRLRPRELGPFDYERPPRTPSLWVAEGLTCYYGDLLLCRAGLWSQETLLAALSRRIAELQLAPGRLVQTLEASSANIWENSFSGLRVADTSVSVYAKGDVVGFLLDMEIRRATDGARSLDDVMRLAYERYAGEQGFTAAQFRDTLAEAAGEDVRAWVERAVASTDELEYDEALAWLGLRFAPATDDQPASAWRLELDPAASDPARARLEAWLGPPEGS